MRFYTNCFARGNYIYIRGYNNGRRFADKSVKDAAISFSVLISADDEKVAYIVTAKHNEKFSAKDLIQLVSTAFKGSGGGRDDFAQGGSQESSDIENKFNDLNGGLSSII